MFTVKELEAATQQLQLMPKSPKKIKVTTEFWHDVTSRCRSELLEEYVAKCPHLPVEIDDEIEGYYKIIY